MKNKSYFTALAAAALVSIPFSLSSAAQQTQEGKMYMVDNIQQSGQVVVDQGDSRMTVKEFLGRPDKTLTADVWIYNNYRGNRSQVQDDNCKTLVITFDGNKVADLRLLNSQAIQIVEHRAAEHGQSTADAMLAAK